MSDFIEQTTATLLDDELLAIHRVVKYKYGEMDAQGLRQDLYDVLDRVAAPYKDQEREIRANLVEQYKRSELRRAEAAHKSKVRRAAKQCERNALNKVLRRSQTLEPGAALQRYRERLTAREQESLRGQLAIEDVKLARKQTTAEKAAEMKAEKRADAREILHGMINPVL
ncbi:hypothetical protein [Sedimenticola hydrogenitrophicus]|uniref:hypothetical protein n=1 Tax=Sedimenticola hydrogenitrophicus TaxID=2967975 RepID=UPI0023B131E9|nr:hypothetical protein [Sedimenticola hydrogenitrophicus]